MIAEPPPTPEREQKLNGLLLEYVEAVERGETRNRYDLLAANVGRGRGDARVFSTAAINWIGWRPAA